jgi:hypothetical protein
MVWGLSPDSPDRSCLVSMISFLICVCILITKEQLIKSFSLRFFNVKKALRFRRAV